jgi:hypothetical protein
MDPIHWLAPAAVIFICLSAFILSRVARLSENSDNHDTQDDLR